MKMDIDVVVAWVDGSDPEWLQKKSEFEPQADLDVDTGEERYRDWGLLKYWFRGIQQFAPWVRKVHFVTCGQKPEWLNLDSDKLNFVTHQDYMPERYLPTFSSHPIELNFHHIEGLSENFIYFNDDMFLCGPVAPELFFEGGLPVHPAQLHAILPLDCGNMAVMNHIYLNMMTVINRHFDSKESIRANRAKWFHFPGRSVKELTLNRFNAQHNGFVGFGNEHLPVPMNKENMEAVWNAEEELLEETCMRKFRSSQDVSQYLFRYWDLASGNFVPIDSRKLGQRFAISKDIDPICHDIRTQKYPMICLNDMNEPCSYEDYLEIRAALIGAFEYILPNKSCFEK